jgi:hypothetical protein
VALVAAGEQVAALDVDGVKDFALPRKVEVQSGLRHADLLRRERPVQSAHLVIASMVALE